MVPRREKAEWRYATRTSGGQSVIKAGVVVMQELSADSSALNHLASYTYGDNISWLTDFTCAR